MKYCLKFDGLEFPKKAEEIKDKLEEKIAELKESIACREIELKVQIRDLACLKDKSLQESISNIKKELEVVELVNRNIPRYREKPFYLSIDTLAYLGF